MKKTVILATAAALVLGAFSAVQADEQKVAPQATTATAAPAAAPAKIEAAKPATDKVAEATKTAAVAEATATKPASTTTAAPAKPTAGPAETTTTTTTVTTTSNTTVRFKVTGLSAMELNDVAKARIPGVNSANCAVDTCTFNIIPTQTNPDTLATWLKGKYTKASVTFLK